MPSGARQDDLRREAIDAARGLAAGDEALVAVLRDLERERTRASASARSVVQALAATLQARDGYTGDHSGEVRDLALAVGGRLGLDRQAMEDLSIVALLHDVGKIGIPDEVLHKDGPLNEADWELMREHPLIGERILASVPGLDRVARAVRHEHENWDGSGYPDGLAGEAIPLASRIVLACDAWHALVSDRPYRRALAADAAAAELRRCSGTQFDPHIVVALFDALADTGSERAGPADAGVLADEPALEAEILALITVATAVASASSVDEILETAANEARIAIGASSLSVDRWIRDANILRTVINTGDLGPGEERYPSNEIYALASDPCARAVLFDHRPYSSSLDDPDLDPVEREILQGFGKHSVCAAPIVFGGEAWGQLWAARTADQPSFGDRDARLLHAVAGQVGSAIGRAELFAHVSELARSDGLTGLANRRTFDEGLELALLAARRDGHDVALVLLDVDNLKEINDTGGHEAGDDALCAVAEMLGSIGARHPGSLVCRIGGDEFGLLLPDCDATRAREIAESALDAMSSRPTPVGLSCGVTALPAGAGRPADLLRAADAAQYAAKRAGRGRVYVADVDGAVAPTPQRRGRRDADRIDLGGLIATTLAVLDGPRAGRDQGERLADVARRCGDATDAMGWTVALASAAGDPETIAVGGRPGSLDGLLRATAWLERRDLAALRLAAGPGRAWIVRADGRDASAALRERLAADDVLALLALAVESADGLWLIELAADARTRDLRSIEPALRLLAPEALRQGTSDARAARGAH
jgi:diguanylate cyclase (GGDEF)-like protein